MKKLIKNESGIITIDFIFALVLVGGFFSIMFALSLTLSVVELTQYITFATARNFHAAHWDTDAQREAAEIKFNDLTKNEIISPLLSNGWFELSGDGGGIDDYNDLYGQDPNTDDSANFIGSRVQLNAKVLEFNIPLIGDTHDDEGVFTANIASYLNREPTSVECLNFMLEENRFQAIKALDSTYSGGSIGEYKVMADNGC